MDSIILLNSDDQNSTNFVSSTNGTITVLNGAVLNYEDNSTIHLIAIATNEFGDSDEANITVNINNLAETPPSIETYTTSVDENASVGTQLGNIPIIEEGDESIIQFVLTGTGSSNFDVNSSGYISVKNGAILNFEDIESYLFEAVAKTASLTSASVNVIINVNDISEIVPILNNTNINFDENSTSNTIIGSIDVNDTGDSNITSYTLSGVGEGNFTIQNDGIVVLNNEIAYDDSGTNEFILTVNAINLAGTSIDKNLTISINEIPTDLPVLNPFSKTIYEGLPSGTVIGQIEIDDGDTVIQEIVITSSFNNHENNFDISKDGTITVSETASLVYVQNNNTYNFDVKAINAIGESNLTRVSITIDFLENLEIFSAVYDDNNTVEDSDDILYLYFSKSIYLDSISNSPIYDIEVVSGSGNIAAGSGRQYVDTPYPLYTITAATGTVAMVDNVTSLRIIEQTLQDLNEMYPKEYVATTVEAFKHILKTGQTASYDQNGTVDVSIKDDFYYNKGDARNYTRDTVNEVVIDNTLQLIWQDNNVTEAVSDWDAAVTYCQDLILGEYENWYLPTKSEMFNIFDKNNYDSSLDDAFVYRDNPYYWTSTVDASDSDNAWRYNAEKGKSVIDLKTSETRYVKCVHLK